MPFAGTAGMRTSIQIHNSITSNIMNRRKALATAIMAVLFMVLGFAFSTNEAAAQCPTYVVDINYLVPAPFSGPVNFDVVWDNGQVDTHSFSVDGKTLWPSVPGRRILHVIINGVIVPVGAKMKVPYPGGPPGMCIEVEIRETSPGCFEIKLQPTGC